MYDLTCYKNYKIFIRKLYKVKCQVFVIDDVDAFVLLLKKEAFMNLKFLSCLFSAISNLFLIFFTSNKLGKLLKKISTLNYYIA